MEARIRRTALLAAVLLVSMGAQQRSANFIVETSDSNFAQRLAQAAEKYRHDLAVEWLGKPMPNWSQPCVMTVQVAPHLGAGGATQFVFDHGEVFGWRMSIQGSAERLLDSVLPHEITHMVYASHFRQPLPRWADEGGATSVEHVSEKNKHRTMLNQFLRTGRGIAFGQMFTMTEYPQDIMPLYAEGYSLAEFLIQTGGRRKYVEFLGDGLQSDDWSGAVQRHYGVRDLGMLQETWLAWVRQGSPLLKSRQSQPGAAGEMLAANTRPEGDSPIFADTKIGTVPNARRTRPEPNLIYRIRDKQSPATPLAALVPVHLRASDTKTSPVLASAAPPRSTVPAGKWIDPSRAAASPAERIAAAVPRVKPTVLPTSGWHIPGDSVATGVAAVSPAAEPSPTQVTHPQPMEQPRQTVIE